MARRRQVSSDVQGVPKASALLGGELASRLATERLTGSIGVFSLDEDPHPSKILAEQSEVGQRRGELYASMLRSDSDLFGLWEKRQKSVVGLPRSIVPADSTDRAKEAAAFCRAALRPVPNFATNIAHQLEAIIHGVSFDEILWHRPERGEFAGKVVPFDIVDRPIHRFLFRRGELYVRRVTGQPVKAPEARFLCYRQGSKDSPWGRPLLDNLYWVWWVKKHGWKYFAVAVEKWAQPTTVAKYKRGVNGTTDEAQIASALDAIDAIQSDYGLAIPEDIVLDLLQAGQQGGAPTYENFIALCTRAESLVMLGEIDTSGLGKGPGSFAKSRVSNEVRLETLRIDAKGLGSHLTESLLAPIVAVNLGPDYPVPRFVIDTTDAEDTELLRAGVEMLLANGEPVPRGYLYRVAKAPEPVDGEPVVMRKETTPPQALESVEADEEGAAA